MAKYPNVVKPLKGAASFSRIGEDSSQAQAAIVLMLGRQLRGDDAATVARAAVAGSKRKVDMLGLESESEFPVPRLAPTTMRVSRDRAVASVARRHGARALERGSSRWDAAYFDTAKRLFRNPTVEAAGSLLELALSHPLDLVRIAAAAAYFPVSAEPARLVDVLAKGCRSKDPLERDVAATALARIEPAHPALQSLVRAGRRRRRARPGRTAMLVHGTWASDSAWWQPGGDFHSYIKGLRPDLYSGTDRFQWTGGYSDAARADGAATLKTWVEDRHESGLDLIGHSHGANVMMLATADGMRAGKLILLSCPVHVDKYFPHFPNCPGGVWSVRVKLDLVILADRGGQKFNDPRIKENVLPIWFNHSAAHEPAVWKQHNIPQKIGL